jgi:poly-gamma-glutamate synthesis protein (capsule biosynthesis protein)
MRKTAYKYRAIGLLCLLLSLASCASGRLISPSAEPPQEPEDYRITLLAAGDNLMHIELINDAKTGGGFDFDKYYEPVAALIKEADIAFVNQETLIAGAAFGYSGYPRFNGPTSVGDALVRAGFDVVSHATNHAMDRGASAVLAALDFWETRKDALVLGIHRSWESRRAVERNIIERNNIKTGFLAYTEHTNQLPLPADKPYLVSLADTEVMAREIDALRPLCDFLVVSMHWGDEYAHTPNSRQLALARFLAAHDVDLVIGHHPHVLQAPVMFERDGKGAMLCYFSLGNFLSAQNEAPRLLGGLMRVGLKKGRGTDAAVSIEEAELVPIVTHYEASGKGFRVYPLDEYTESLAARHYLRQKDRAFGPASLKRLLEDVMGGR